uniref:Uncharacterized protein n=1 Tax=Picornavirales sp. TaxID=1955153 RepID=A0A6M3YNW9_9VIRU|nr:MAG: hypothetical protein 3 [Picornavirales sp.]QKN88974.1 MAG: hypothetical protein 4 [Picornavirales sp.]
MSHSEHHNFGDMATSGCCEPSLPAALTCLKQLEHIPRRLQQQTLFLISETLSGTLRRETLMRVVSNLVEHCKLTNKSSSSTQAMQCLEACFVASILCCTQDIKTSLTTSRPPTKRLARQVLGFDPQNHVFTLLEILRVVYQICKTAVTHPDEVDHPWSPPIVVQITPANVAHPTPLHDPIHQQIHILVPMVRHTLPFTPALSSQPHTVSVAETERVSQDAPSQLSYHSLHHDAAQALLDLKTGPSKMQETSITQLTMVAKRGSWNDEYRPYT